MAHIEHYKRRCGNTTRQVDEWIQALFNGEPVVISDHAHKKGNMANSHAEQMFLTRLHFEHNLKPGRSSMLQYDTRTGVYSLIPSKYLP